MKAREWIVFIVACLFAFGGGMAIGHIIILLGMWLWS